MSRADNELRRSYSHHVTERCIQWISLRKQQRYASDGKLYTYNEFSAYYSKNADNWWTSASHFNSLQDFCQYFDLQLVRSYWYCFDESQWWASSPAMFGLRFPCCLLLVDAHHLNGKLKGSKLSRKDWDNAWKIGPAGNAMMAMDFYTELHDDNSSHILGKLGRAEMEAELREFCAILDGSYSSYRFSHFDVEGMTGWLHVPCCDFMCHARHFFACHAIFLHVMLCHERSVSCHVSFFSAKWLCKKK